MGAMRSQMLALPNEWIQSNSVSSAIRDLGANASRGYDSLNPSQLSNPLDVL